MTRTAFYVLVVGGAVQWGWPFIVLVVGAIIALGVLMSGDEHDRYE